MNALSYAPTVVSLSDLAPPDILDALSFDDVVAEMKAAFAARWATVRAKDPSLPAYDVTMLETDSAVILIEAFAYRELLVRARVNDAARGLLLAYAAGTNLDHLAALFGVTRLDGEGDERLRRRVQLAPETFSTAGAQGAYIFHALSADLGIFDAWAYSPKAGRVNVVLAGPDGTLVSDDVVAKVVDLFQREDITPLTDEVAVVRAEVLRYGVEATLLIPRGPDPGTLKTAAEAAIRAYGASRYKIAQTHYRLGHETAAKVPAVETVLMGAPLSDIRPTDKQIGYLDPAAVTLRTQVLL
ncbi:baseplate assembly protein [Methylobacterium nigriterrae]|uniref:baseplate assembly protein n=1 Tax=Methylobacterium nigriterrae TaxID=3127512 RepID=UPI00301400B8